MAAVAGSAPRDQSASRDAAVEHLLASSTTPPAEVIKRIEAQLVGYTETLLSGRDPSIVLHSDRPDEVSLPGARTLELSSKRGAYRHASIWLIWAQTYELLRQNKSCTLRELYYNNATVFKSQAEANAAVIDACLSLGGISRHSLGIFPSVKGLVAGSIFVEPGVLGISPASLTDHVGLPSPAVTDGTAAAVGASASQRAPSSATGAAEDGPGAPASSSYYIDLAARTTGVRIPFRATHELTGIVPHSAATFILVVEKEGIFERLLEDGFPKKYPCVLVTGKGFPDLPTRALVWQLHMRFALPVYGLADYNPYGAAIMLAYCDLPASASGDPKPTGRRGGSAGASVGTKFTVPVRWLGMFDRDVEALPDSVLQEMSSRDTSRAEGLIRDHPDLPELCEEVQLMVDGGYKAEIEALHAHGLGHLTETFLPERVGDPSKWILLARD